MSAADTGAIATLLRWREFQEDRAADAYGRRVEQTRHAELRSEEAQARVDEVRQAQARLLEAGALDLDRLRAVAAIEDAAWRRAQAAQAEQRDAQAAQLRAREAHVAARGDTRVARSRHDRVAAQVRDREEKRQFDLMADLFNQSKSHARATDRAGSEES